MFMKIFGIHSSLYLYYIICILCSVNKTLSRTVLIRMHFCPHADEGWYKQSKQNKNKASTRRPTRCYQAVASMLKSFYTMTRFKKTCSGRSHSSTMLESKWMFRSPKNRHVEHQILKNPTTPVPTIKTQRLVLLQHSMFYTVSLQLAWGRLSLCVGCH